MSDAEDVSTTKRKRLSRRQRLALFERYKGLCAVCGNKIVGDFIDEHWRALGLGGSNGEDNRVIAHPKCAAAKTKDDMERINKAKDQKQAAHGIKRERRKLESRNDLPKREKGEPKALPPRRGGIAAQYGLTERKK